MSEKNETLAEIAAEMRNGPIPRHRRDQELLRFFADRIEAAHKREKAEAEADALAVGGMVEAERHNPGNAAAMREAIEELMKFTCNSCERRLCEDDAEEEDGQRVPSPCSEIIKARAALAAPPRNCDVYDAKTAEKEFVRQTGSKSIRSKSVRWLYAQHNSEAVS